MDFFRVVAAIETKDNNLLNQNRSFFNESYDLRATQHNADKPFTVKELQNQFITQPNAAVSDKGKIFI